MRPIPTWFERAILFHWKGGYFWASTAAFGLAVLGLALKVSLAGADWSRGLPFALSTSLLDPTTWMVLLSTPAGIAALLLHRLPSWITPPVHTGVVPWTTADTARAVEEKEREDWEDYTTGIARTAAVFGPTIPHINTALYGALQVFSRLRGYPHPGTIHVHRRGTALYPFDRRRCLNLSCLSMPSPRIGQILVRANWQVGGWRQALVTSTQDYMFSVTNTPLTAHQRLRAAQVLL